MSIITILSVAVGLAMDATAVAVASSISMGRVTQRQVFRFAFHFGLFQAVMPVIGWLAGLSVLDYIQDWDHWVAFGLLALIGSKALYDARVSDEASSDNVGDPTRGWSLVILSVATSIDALAVGITLVFLGVPIWYPCLVIGVVTAVLTTGGMLLGSRLGNKFGRRMRSIGGFVLLAIGTKILIEHLWS
jgi:putative Mn2+ efflux pump MntP